jgi:carboxypeptidase Q
LEVAVLARPFALSRRAPGVGSLALALALAAAPAGAQEQVDAAAIDRLKAEGFQKSQVMELASWLTDVHGPRLTNSPQARAAGEWAVETLKGWGLQNVGMEWFPFGRGWQNDRMVAHVVSPTPYPVLAFPGAWTVGTNGPVTADVVIVDLPDQPTDADYAALKGKLKGKIVLAASLPNVPPLMTAPGSRMTAEALDRLAAAAVIPAPAPAGGRPGGPAGPGNRSEAMRARMEAAQRRSQFFVEEGVAALLTPGTSRGNSGSVSNGPTGARTVNAPASVPQIAVSAEHYGRMYRQVQKGIPVRMELDVRNRFTPDTMSFNLVAELPGTDRKDEVVMLGAHFDSWHNATGATDNGGSSAVMMEAMRILKASGVPLRRTVRMALWTGEEQGLIGSREYVTRHFGTLEQPKPGHEKVVAYFNQDNGGGAIRGIYTQGNEAAVAVFKEWIRALDSDSITVRHVSMNSTGSTDHVSFDRAGIPGFQFIQDPLEYGTRTHHSSQDFYERLQPADMRHNAVVLAAFAYLAANRDEPLPRKPKPAATDEN